MASLFILLLGLGETGKDWEKLGETGRNWEDGDNGGKADAHETWTGRAQSNINYELTARNTLTARTGTGRTTAGLLRTGTDIPVITGRTTGGC